VLPVAQEVPEARFLAARFPEAQEVPVVPALEALEALNFPADPSPDAPSRARRFRKFRSRHARRILLSPNLTTFRSQRRFSGN
jgi:hypothetical protein